MIVLMSTDKDGQIPTQERLIEHKVGIANVKYYRLQPLHPASLTPILDLRVLCIVNSYP